MSEKGLFFPEDGAERPIVEQKYRALRPEDLYNDGILADPDEFILGRDGVLYLDSQAKLSRSTQCDLESGTVDEIPAADKGGFVGLYVTTDEAFKKRFLIADIRYVRPGEIYESDTDIVQRATWPGSDEEPAFWPVNSIIQNDNNGKAYFSGNQSEPQLRSAAVFWCNFVDKLMRERAEAQAREDAGAETEQQRPGLRTLVTGLAKVIRNGGRS